MSFDMFGNTDLEINLDKVAKIPFGGYTGNKRKILKDIWLILEKENIEFDSVFDAFCGSAVFSLFMKNMGKRVIANDFLTSSYLNALALVENPGYLLNYDEMMFVVNNEPEYNVEDGFVYKNYLNKRFTDKECRDLDKFRINLSLLDNSYKAGVGFLNTRTTIIKSPFGSIDRGVDMFKHRIKQMETYGKGAEEHDRRIGLYFDENMNLDFKQWFVKYNQKFSNSIFSHDNERIMMGKAFLLRNMESNILRNCFIGGRYNNGQVIANLAHRQQHEKHNGLTDIDFVKELLKDYFSEKYDGLLSGENKRCLALNCDIITLLENTNFVTDVVYLDPPYGGASSDYAYLYQFLEEYVYGDTINNLEHIKNYGKRFVNGKTYEENFIHLLELLKRFPTWILSYNDSSWQNKDYIISLLSRYKKYVKVHDINDYVYLYRNNKKEKSGTEYIFVARD